MSGLTFEKDGQGGFFMYPEDKEREEGCHITPLDGSLEEAMEKMEQCMSETGGINLDFEDFSKGEYVFTFKKIQTQDGGLTEEEQKAFEAFMKELAKKVTVKQRVIIQMRARELSMISVNDIIEYAMKELEGEDSSADYYWGLTLLEDGEECVNFWIE